MKHYDPVIRGTEAVQILTDIKGRISDENVRRWRNVCCVNPNVGCRNCPIGIPPKDEDHGWCHEWFVASMRLSLKTRLDRINKYVGNFK